MERVTITSELPSKAPRTASKVKGPIRCHKCQLKCRDAEHYLSHACKPAREPECSPFPRPETGFKEVL